MDSPTQPNQLGVQYKQRNIYEAVFNMVLENQNRFSNANCPPYPRLVGLVVAKFNRVTKDRDQRLALMSAYIGRQLTSAKHMTTAECVTWLKMLEREPFIQYLKEELHA